MAGTDQPVAARLAAEVEAGRLTADVSQQEAARHLDRLSVQLRSQLPSFTFSILDFIMSLCI